jgi:NADP-dependent 3-hydroxy acid dehydrogenase YdfG
MLIVVEMKFTAPKLVIDCLAGKVVWITGASSGIGENMAVAFSRARVKLVLSARRESELQRVKQNCLSEYVNSDLMLSFRIMSRVHEVYEKSGMYLTANS